MTYWKCQEGVFLLFDNAIVIWYTLLLYINGYFEPPEAEWGIIMDIRELIGEATDYDKKVALERKKPKSWCKSVSAFANTSGGSLVFGISNDNELIGLENAEEDAEVISEEIKNRLSPVPEFMLRFDKVDNKKFIILDVFKGMETPYYYTADGTTEAYVRIGNESVKANSTELKRLVLRGRNSPYDMQNSGYKFEDYSFSHLKARYYKITKNSFDNKFFTSWNIIDTSGNLTNAGALLADESPIWYSRAFCTRWNGLKKTEAIDSAEYSGSIIYLLSESSAFIRRNMKVKWKKLPESRVDFPDYIERSYFEALVNGYIHRDYLITGGEVHVDIFDDRLEIYSPGGMVDGTMIQDRNIDYVPSERRNPLLADIFARLDYMERKGSGLGLIRDGYSNAPNFIRGKEPVFYSDSAQFRIILPNLNYKNEMAGKLIEDDKQNKVQDRVQDRVQDDKKLINIIGNDVIGHVTAIEFLEYCKLPRTRMEMQEFCGLAARRNFNERYLNPLLEKGVLKMIMPDKPKSKKQRYYSEL